MSDETPTVDDLLFSIAGTLLDDLIRQANGGTRSIRAADIGTRTRGLTFEQRERAVRLVAERRPEVSVGYWHPCPECSENFAFRTPPKAVAGDRVCDHCGEEVEMEDHYIFAVVSDCDPASMLYTLRNKTSRLAGLLMKYGHVEHAEALEAVAADLTAQAKAVGA